MARKKRLTLSDVKEKLKVSKEEFNKFILYLISLEDGEELFTKVYRITKKPGLNFEVSLNPDAINQLIDDWFSDNNSPLDIIVASAQSEVCEHRV